MVGYSITFRKGDSEIVIKSIPSKWGEWYDSTIIPGYAPLGALDVTPWPVRIGLERAWEMAKAENGNLIGTLIHKVTLSNPFGNPMESDNVPKYDFDIGGGKHLTVLANGLLSDYTGPPGHGGGL